MDYLEDQKTKPWINILAGSLYLLTVGLGILTFFSGRRMVLSTLSRFGAGGSQTTSQDPFSLFNILISFPLLFLVIAIIIGGFEFHFSRVGTNESWELFTKTLGVEIGILLLALFI
jgi:hypothetical protein